MLIAPSKSPSSHGSQSVKKTIDGLQIFVVVAIVVVVVDATTVVESLSLVSLVVKVLVLAMVAVGDDDVCCDIGVAKPETLIVVDEIKLESVDETLVA